MKALGISFFGAELLKTLVAKEESSFTVCQKENLTPQQKPVKALAVDFFETKVRFYPLPKAKRHTQKKLLFTRLSNDLMLDLELLIVSFKEVPQGVEVHLAEKKVLEPLKKEFDFLTTSEQALFRYMRDFKGVKQSALVLVDREKQTLCLHYTPNRWLAFATVDSSSKNHEAIQKHWGLEKIFYLSPIDSLGETNGHLTKELLPIEALAVGAGIEALDTEGVFFHDPLENEDFQKELLKKSKNVSFLLGLLLASLCIFFAIHIQSKGKQIEREILVYQQLEDFPKQPTKNAKKISSLLKELSSSLEPFGLELLECEVKQELIEKKPYLEMRFRIDGESQQMEKYEQSVRKISASIFSKMQPVSEGKKGTFSLKIPI
jgi:hypothetical protein